MSWLSRVVNVFREERVTDELDEELQFHVESRARDLIADGLAPDEAYREARRRLGNAGVIRERSREVKLVAGLDALLRDMRFAIRMLRRDLRRLAGRDRLPGAGDWRLHGGVRARRRADPSAAARPRSGDARLRRRARRRRPRPHVVQLSALRAPRRGGEGSRRAGRVQLPVPEPRDIRRDRRRGTRVRAVRLRKRLWHARRHTRSRACDRSLRRRPGRRSRRGRAQPRLLDEAVWQGPARDRPHVHAGAEDVPDRRRRAGRLHGHRAGNQHEPVDAAHVHAGAFVALAHRPWLALVQGHGTARGRAPGRRGSAARCRPC